MKSITTTILLPTLLSYASSAWGCSPETAEDVTSYFIEWGVIDEDDISSGGGGGGGNSYCTMIAVEYGAQAWNECIEASLPDVNFKPRLVKKSNISIVTRRQSFDCDSGEVCGAFPAVPEAPFCMDPDTGDWHDSEASTGNFFTGQLTMADGTTSNLYPEGEAPADKGILPPSSSSSSSSGSDSGSSSDSDSNSSSSPGSNSISGGSGDAKDIDSGATTRNGRGKVVASLLVAAIAAFAMS